jgi:cytochrome c-type biogenesis protein CcmH
MKTRRGSRNALVVFIILAMWIFPAAQAFAVTAGEITQGLTCTCGCNMLVSACEGSMECTAAANITDEVVQLLDTGKSKDEIIKYFMKSYGERILAAPTKKGFNLTAWILPFVAVVVGGAGIYMFLNRCLASRKDTTAGLAPSDDKAQKAHKKYLDKVEKELADFQI